MITSQLIPLLMLMAAPSTLMEQHRGIGQVTPAMQTAAGPYQPSDLLFGNFTLVFINAPGCEACDAIADWATDVTDANSPIVFIVAAEDPELSHWLDRHPLLNVITDDELQLATQLQVATAPTVVEVNLSRPVEPTVTLPASMPLSPTLNAQQRQPTGSAHGAWSGWITSATYCKLPTGSDTALQYSDQHRQRDAHNESSDQDWVDYEFRTIVRGYCDQLSVAP